MSLSNQFGVPSTITSTLVPELAEVLHTASDWQVVTVIKNTSGTIVIGSTGAIQPSNNGGGIALASGEPVRLLLGPGSELWGVAGGAGEAIGIHVQPLTMVGLLIDALGHIMSLGDKAQVPGPAAGAAYPGQAGFKQSLLAVKR